MTDYRKMTASAFRLKSAPKSSEPFPPCYYESEKKAKALLAQMQNPELVKLKH